jgi:glycosyltransferase involved in cell wall biosynthesis
MPSTQRGGAEEYALTIAKAAVEQGWTVHAAFPRTEGTAALIQDFQASQVTYHRLVAPLGGDAKLSPWLNALWQCFFIVILLLKVRPHVAQITLPSILHSFGSILACSCFKVPTLVVFQLAPTPILLRSHTLKAYGWARARNQKWLAVSEQNRKSICKTFQIPLEDVLCVYNGAALNPISRVTATEMENLRQQVLQELNIPHDHQIILTVGRLTEQKGYQDLIPVIPSITQEFPNLTFVWAGEGELRSQLVQQLKDYNATSAVQLLGYRSDVSRLLAAADLFIFPSHNEGLPFALLEAMAHGLPILASNASSIPEIVTPGVHGLLFSAGNQPELLTALRWALRHPKEMQKMAENAQLRVQTFSQERMLRETLMILRNLASRSTQQSPVGCSTRSS